CDLNICSIDKLHNLVSSQLSTVNCQQSLVISYYDTSSKYNMPLFLDSAPTDESQVYSRFTVAGKI
ncbi:hypothetical protein, partial [Microcoleus sp. LEGE 07076]|uniref:hypothetical protein n=1 Tax=Microcoleus sp. LEGE 07076 TaxID=915322 RepID=UPI001D13306C